MPLAGSGEGVAPMPRTGSGEGVAPMPQAGPGVGVAPMPLTGHNREVGSASALTVSCAVSVCIPDDTVSSAAPDVVTVCAYNDAVQHEDGGELLAGDEGQRALAGDLVAMQPGQRGDGQGCEAGAVALAVPKQ